MPLNLPTTPVRPSSRTTLAQYCLQALGAPVLDIAIDNDQLSDRIEDAMEFFREFHYDGVERMYLKHQITGNALGLVDATMFTTSELLIGQTSGASATALKIFTDTVLYVDEPNGTFLVGETVKGAVTGFTAVVTSFAFGDMHNKFIPCDDSIQGVINVFPFTDTSSVNNVFDIRFQLRLSDLYSLQSAELAQYQQIMYTLSNMDFIFNGETNYRFNRKMNEIYLDFDWYENLQPGMYLVVECYRALDPSVYSRVYNDRALKKLAVSYVKKQWGTNLKLYDGVLLPGGLKLNGQIIYDEAVQDVKEAEDYIRDTYQEPPFMMIG
jgi:hypothetical protein